MTVRNYIDNAPAATAAAPVGPTDGTASVSSLVGFPTSFPYTATFDRGQTSAEVVLVTGASGTTVTITRNYDGLGAFGHSVGATFEHTAVALDYQEANAHVNASSGVHGASGAVVGTNNTQTLNNKTLVSPVVTGGMSVAGALTLSTSETDSGSLDVTGTLTAHGALVASTTLAVTGTSTLTGDVTVVGNETVDTDLTVSGKIHSPQVAITGWITPFAGRTTPSGWLMCDGSALATASYPDLYAALVVPLAASVISSAPTVPASSNLIFTITVPSTTGIRVGDRTTWNGTSGFQSGVVGSIISGTQFTVVGPSGLTTTPQTVYVGQYGMSDASHFLLPDATGNTLIGTIAIPTYGGATTHTHDFDSSLGRAQIDVTNGSTIEYNESGKTSSYNTNRAMTFGTGAGSAKANITDTAPRGVGLDGTTGGVTTTGTTASDGYPPYMLVNYIIKT